jgi:beta-galactosidase
MFFSRLTRKYHSFILLSLLVIQVSISAETQEQQREATPAKVNPVLRSKLSQTISLDGKWDFATDPQKQGEKKQWYRSDVPLPNKRDIQVPGCWEAQGVGEPGYSQPPAIRVVFEVANRPILASYHGSAWYRKTIEVPAKWQDNKIWLKFGGINSVGWIWVNGKFVAKHYEYAGTYKYDITDLVTAGKSATVAVLVRNDIPSLQGESQCIRTYGGLYRSVELEATPSVLVDYAYVQGDLDTKSAAVHATIRSEASESRKVKVEVKLKTLKGKKAGKASKSITIEPGKTTEVVFDIPVKPFKSWSPEHPNLYRADIVIKDGKKAVHGWVERFGIKKFETHNKQFLLNNNPHFLRGYGDDHTYPLTICSPADRKAHLENLSKARAFGFNFVRHHTHVEFPEYFQAADELGMMVQPEIPYLPHEDGVKSQSGGRIDPLGDLRTLVKHFRGYVSLSVYGGGNEGHYKDELAKELYELAKELDPSRPWISQDGDNKINTANGLNTQLTGDYSDFQAMTRVGSGDPFQVPITEEEDKWPLLQHEFQSFSTGPDARLEPKYRDGYAPDQKLADAQALVEAVGLDWKWGAACIDAGHRLQSIFHKIGLESSRLDPRLDGYTLWLLVDFPPFAYNGIMDVFYGYKQNTPEYFRTFNQSVVLLAKDPDPKPWLFITNEKWPSLGPPDYVFDQAAIEKRMTENPTVMRPMLNAFYDRPLYVSGQTIPVEWAVSNFGEVPIKNAKMTWRLFDGKEVLSKKTLSNVTVEIGDVATVTKAQITMPEVTKPLKARLELAIDRGRWSNSWDIWVFPELKKKADLGQKLAVSEGLYDLLSNRYDNVVRLTDPAAKDAKVLIVDEDGDAIVESLKQGKKVLYLNVPEKQRITVGARRMGSWFWREQAGTVIEAEHPAFGDFPNEGFMNQPWFRLMDRAAKLTPNGPVKQADMLMVGYGNVGEFSFAFNTNVGYYSYVFEANSGKGSVLVSGLDLTRNNRDLPESAYLLDQMIRYVVSEDFSPTGRVDPSFFRGMVDATAILKQLNGFDKIINTVVSQSYDSGSFGLLPTHFVRQTDGKGTLKWRTKPLTEDNINSDGDAVFQ